MADTSRFSKPAALSDASFVSPDVAPRRNADGAALPDDSTADVEEMLGSGPLHDALTAATRWGMPDSTDEITSQSGDEPDTKPGRETAYQTELLILFRERLRLTSALGMIFLPGFSIFYAFLLPRKIVPICAIYGVLFCVCAVVRAMARRIHTVPMARALTLSAYAIGCAGSSLIVSVAGPHNPLIFGGHNHIALSLLLMPLALWDCALVGVMVNLSLAWAGWWNLDTQPGAIYVSHLFVLLSTTVFVLSIAHMQATLRRRAFDATFDLKRSADKLQKLSFLDTLTGGFNRRYLDKTLAVEVARAVRFERPLSIMMFDLDNFKRVNDTRGHAAGDEVLREVWQAGQSAIREVDTLARYGGDEFSVVLPETDETSARIIAERLQEAARYRLHERFGNGTPEAGVTLSIGLITVRPHEMIHPDKLLDGADERLYAAKRCGKNSIAT